MPRRHNFPAWAVFAALALATGCQSPLPAAPACWRADQRADLFIAANHALREQGFRITHCDTLTGTIACWPRGIPTHLEPWVSGAGDPQWRAAADTGDLRHRVRMQLVSNADQTVKLQVEAIVERRDRALRHTDASLASPASDLSELPEEWRQAGMQADAWRPIGRDRQMEDTLVRAAAVLVNR